MSELDDRERARLCEIARLGLGADIEEPYIQGILADAAEELELPIAAVSIVLDSAQYFIASHGLGGWPAQAKGTPIEWSFCRRVVEARAPFVVNDAGQHELVGNNPLVKIDGIKSYLGVPLVTTGDHVLGALCVIGHQLRIFEAGEIDFLQELAEEVVTLLEDRSAKPAFGPSDYLRPAS